MAQKDLTLYQLRVIIMIDLRQLAQFQYCEERIRILCTDGQELIGTAGEVDDEEESGFDEPGITIYLEKGTPVSVALSEIDSISRFADRTVIEA